MRRWYDFMGRYSQIFLGCWGFFAFQPPRDAVAWTLGSVTALTLVYVLLFRRNAEGYTLFGTVGGLVFIIAGAWHLLWYT